MPEDSLLVKFFGGSPFIRAIDFLIENRPYDCSKAEIVRGAGISKAALFSNWAKIEEYGIVKLSRRFGNTKLYKLNTANPLVRQLMELETVLIRASLTAHKVRVAVPVQR